MLLSFQLVTRNSCFTISHTHTQPVYHKNVVLRILSLFYVATGNSFYYGKSINIYQEMIKGLICWWVKIKFSKSERKEKRFGGFFKNLARSITPKQKVDLKFCQKRYPPKKKKNSRVTCLMCLHVILVYLHVILYYLHYQPRIFFFITFHLLNLFRTIPLIFQCFLGFCRNWSRILGTIEIKRSISTK